MSDLTAELALLVSLVVAVWNVMQFRLLGGRVRVVMLADLWDEHSLATGPDWDRLEAQSGSRGGWTVETAVIDIENAGRTAVTATAPALDFGRAPGWRGQRSTVIPSPLPAPDSERGRAYRLEPFDSVRYVYDVWHVLDSSPFGSSLTPPRPLRLRAAVKVAGRRRPSRSSWRRGWPVRQGQFGFASGSDDVALVAFRAMRRYLPNHDGAESFASRFACTSAAIAIRKSFPVSGRSPTMEQISQLLEKNHTGGSAAMYEVSSLAAEHHLRRLYAVGLGAGEDREANDASAEVPTDATPSESMREKPVADGDDAVR